MDTIVIGEGVELDARPASAISRMLGALIDLAVLVAVLLLVAILLTNVARIGVPEAVADVGGTVAIAFVLIVLPTTVDTLTRGRTLGKLAVGIRVVRDDGGPIVFRQAFVRALVGVVELWLTFGSVALICSLVHPQGKRVGDILAGTYAVRVRGGAGDGRRSSCRRTSPSGRARRTSRVCPTAWRCPCGSSWDGRRACTPARASSSGRA